MVVRSARAIGSVACALVAISTNTFAHLGHGIASGERRISLELGERDVVVNYSLGLAAGKTQSDLEAAHERSEESAKLDQLTRELSGAVKLCAGDTWKALACRPLSPKELESVAASGWKTDTLTLDWRFRIPVSERALRLEDGWNREEVGRTDVLIRPHASRPLLRAGPDEPQGVEVEFAFDDRLLAGAPRVVSIELSPRRGIGVLPLISVAILVALATVAFFSVRRKQRALKSGA